MAKDKKLGDILVDVFADVAGSLGDRQTQYNLGFKDAKNGEPRRGSLRGREDYDQGYEDGLKQRE